MKPFAVFALILGLSLSAFADEPVFKLAKSFRILTMQTLDSPGGTSQIYMDAIRSNTDKVCALTVQMCEETLNRPCVRMTGGIAGSESNAAVTTYHIECQARQVRLPQL